MSPPGTHDHRIDPELAPYADIIPRDLLADLDASRELFRTLTDAMEPTPEEQELEITDTEVPGPQPTPVRVYRRPGDHRRPGVLYLHGGGYCLGDVNTEHRPAVALTHALDTVTVNVDYRLAPEHPYPAALDDCTAALQWLVARPDVDTDRIALVGTSAGAGLVAALALRCRDRGGPPLAFQAMVAPVLDDRLDTPSMRSFEDTPLWNRPQAEKMWHLYLAGTDPVPAEAAPCRATDLRDLPPAYVAVNELDPLRDEGIAYASALLAAGVSVELHAFPGTFHASNMIPYAEISRRGADELRVALSHALGVS